MNDLPKYFDIRSAFWKSCYEEAVDYDQYLRQSPSNYAHRWEEMAGTIPPLTDDESRRLKGIHRVLNVLVVSGVWCGDCVRQGPMLQRIVDACNDTVSLRVIDRDANRELRDEVRILGAMRVPIAVFLTEEFFEVGRFGDRTLMTYRRKAVNEIGPACPVSHLVSDEEKHATELSEWVDIFERMLLMARLSPPLRARHGD